MLAMMLGLVEIGGLLLLLLLVPIGLALFAFWLWMLIHALQNKGLSDGERIAWVLVIVLVSVIGPLIYFFVGRPKAKQVLVPAMTVAGQLPQV